MASPGDAFPAADAEKELNPGENKNFEVDPVSSEVATSLQIKVMFPKSKPAVQMSVSWL